MPRPNLKITGLHIEGLKALHRVDWPKDGMGWNGVVPDMVMVGGANGSGKTTLLEFIVAMMSVIQFGQLRHAPGTSSTNALVTTEIESTQGSAVWTILVGDDSSATEHRAVSVGNRIWLKRSGEPVGVWGANQPNLLQDILRDPTAYTASDIPNVLYMPSGRTLEIPKESFKATGHRASPTEFVYTFRPPGNWKESLEALLYSARWEDLNAKEEGRPQDATRFQAFADTFALFFEGRKQVTWRGGELVVALADGVTTHSLAELSSGEKQVIILAAELLYRWRPGSLILIDEPELHLHPTWLSHLWAMLTQWQQERGGQVIVATQSNHLFRIGEPGTKVILGQDPIA